MTNTKTRFEALSRICLNNWHYISHKVLSFHEGINFFTGHSGSGKSTVIDAMQIVLYANTDGRGFFNKAAADDSDRNLIEYLRGMINIGENNEFAYLRNQNFSTTIVLELRQTDTGECQCVGVVFDVETATNEISRLFFWHKGPMPEHVYRTDGRAMSINEMKRWLGSSFSKEDCYFGSHNERFRKQLYDIYLGGLDAEKFPLLFKRAIPFRMNIRLEDFVKEYICMEQDIHIEDMQQSVMQYGRMRKRIEDTWTEIGQLKEICEQNQKTKALDQELKRYQYYVDRLDILQQAARIQTLKQKLELTRGDIEAGQNRKTEIEQEIARLTKESETLLMQISASGYEQMKQQLASLNELVERLTSSKARWQQTAAGLKAWEDQDMTSNRTLWDIESFEQGTILEEVLLRLQKDLQDMQKEIQKEQQETHVQLRELRKEEQHTKEELAQLKAGNKAYPKDLEQAKIILQNRLYQETGKSVQVEILADLMEIADESWRNAIEGYLGNNKLTLMVKPAYAKTALRIYEEMDKQTYFRVSVADTEKIMEDIHRMEEHSLAEEVSAKRDYAQAYLEFLLGKVVKCQNTEELRQCRIGITRDCVLYQNYRIQHINPENYTRFAYIGKNSLRARIKLLEHQLAQLSEEREPKQQILAQCEAMLRLECLPQDASVYLEWKQDMDELKQKEDQQKILREKLETMKAQNIGVWEEERKSVQELCDAQKEVLRKAERTMFRNEQELEKQQKEILALEGELTEKQGSRKTVPELEEGLQELLRGSRYPRYEVLRAEYQGKYDHTLGIKEKEKQNLVDKRVEYLRNYPNRNYSPTSEDNREYEELLEYLNCDRLEEYRKAAAEQARSAMEHFKDDFMFKIRSAIREALQRKDELNRIISRLDFGKDKYQFYIGKNKGADGRYYDMFMDDALEINPSQLEPSVDQQMNLFTMEHENHYGELMNDLINMFIPPEHASTEELEEAKRNMEKYADYRTYLSFDMQQLVQNEDETIHIRLSKMLRKNSGGEGQNPLYVALLASFAQAYRINLPPKLQRHPTIRLVVLDEAFSKMDAEKVASCIQLIRGLGFQALISATNDKMQNYLETVDKVFVFANPNKKRISIQEFEKEGFHSLAENLEEEV